jgi:hypothetical protein
MAEATREENTTKDLTLMWTGFTVTPAPDVLVLDFELDVVVDDSFVPVVLDEDVSVEVG